MDDAQEPALVIDLSGPNWHIQLTVAPPANPDRKSVDFDVPMIGAGTSGQLRRIRTEVIFTTATNERNGWQNWHVKIYGCADLGDAEALRQHLHEQASALQRANQYLGGHGRRTPIEPPWAVVPVQVVRGDGQLEQLSGAITTRLGTPSDQIVAQLDRRLPSWIGVGARPDLYLLAVSPQIDLLKWESLRRWPGTEHLIDFRQLATGLDQLHQLKWAHCDLKPDNVCWCTYQETSGYVLIDTDAATQADPPPSVLRGTELYEYGGLRRMRTDPARGWHLTPGLLYAQDRFGLMIVVLCALAGRHWVENTLLNTDPDDPRCRVADSETAVSKALREHWADPRWEPLIAVLAEPFGTGPRGQLALETPRPWAEAWLAAVIAAEQRCERDGRPQPAPAGTELVSEYAGHIEAVRAYAQHGPATRPERVHRAYDAIGSRAQEVALRQAVLWLSIWGLSCVAVAVALGVLVGGG
jgi:hypothetical protein